ncbi:MAG: tRNA (adenosine(37)-N6)-threonylcarbamoyltransferase complex dimerization subunit type 1 TsaB [Lachnospiraceae bacterium]|nr:tRNA (adenosine(37)-N6)-threonylcarbamoyltransferase complex dimerization subunit type 1 TsaB [Lachnospiraceae bacterium]
MKILGIESSSLTASAAIWEDGILTAEYTVNFKKTHSQTLLPMIDEICRMTEQEPKTMDAIAVASGPGSFTGLRIGAATAKGLALALALPVVAVPTLDAMAYQCFDAVSVICPIMDARRGQVYNGLYEWENGRFCIKQPSRAIDMAEVIEELNAAGGPVIFLGDGVPVQEEQIRARLHVPFYLAPATMNRQRAGAVASLGAEQYAQGRLLKAEEFAPKYLRPSQAERVRQEKNR